MKKILIVFDIDGVLGNVIKTDVDIEPAIHAYLGKKGVRLDFGSRVMPHYLYPGVLELIRYLAAQEHVEIAFFSAGPRTRNVLFVNRLISEALEGQNLKYEAKIKSRYDRTVEMTNNVSVRKKDLRTMFSLPVETPHLSNVILVDDLSTNAASGQEKNLLLSHSVSNADFGKLNTPDLTETSEHWDLSGIAQLNQIYYIAGVLQACIAQKMLMPMTTLLPAIQDLNEKQWYLDGLSCLQQYNPKLRFNSHEHFKQTLQRIIPSSYIRLPHPCAPESSSSSIRKVAELPAEALKPCSSSEKVLKKTTKMQEKTIKNRYSFLNPSKRSRKHEPHKKPVQLPLSFS